MQNNNNKNVLQTVAAIAALWAFIALAVVSCINTPTVAFNGNGQCQWVENKYGRDLTACNNLPNKYNRITVATR
ncbi:MAG: hypothetical protein ACJA2A_002073 [Cycloclasticus pugetii]|jgi:hypothetical protein